MAISQVMWKLLNGQVCDWDVDGNCTASLGTGVATMSLARRNFTLALKTLRGESVETFLLDILLRYAGTSYCLFNATTWPRLRRAFTENGVDVPTWALAIVPEEGGLWCQ